MNVWIFLLMLTPPLLAFTTKAEARSLRHIGRLLTAIAVSYCLINFSLHIHYAQSWALYEACQTGFPDGHIQQHKACESPPNGAPLTFSYILGWIPAAAYVGFWELLWRGYHRKQIRELEKRFPAKWISNLTIIIFILCCAWPIIALLSHAALTCC